MLENSKIFVIEDNSFYQKLLKTILEKDHHHVISLDGTEDIIAALKEHNPFLIITDMHLAENVQGIHLIRSIRATELYKKIPIIAISAHMHKIKHLELEENFACHILNKPIDIVHLMSIVKKIKDTESE